MKRSEETEIITAFAERKTERKRARGRPVLRLRDSQKGHEKGSFKCNHGFIYDVTQMRWGCQLFGGGGNVTKVQCSALD